MNCNNHYTFVSYFVTYFVIHTLEKNWQISKQGIIKNDLPEVWHFSSYKFMSFFWKIHIYDVIMIKKYIYFS